MFNITTKTIKPTNPLLLELVQRHVLPSPLHLHLHRLVQFNESLADALNSTCHKESLSWRRLEILLALLSGEVALYMNLYNLEDIYLSSMLLQLLFIQEKHSIYRFISAEHCSLTFLAPRIQVSQFGQCGKNTFKYEIYINKTATQHN